MSRDSYQLPIALTEFSIDELAFVQEQTIQIQHLEYSLITLYKPTHVAAFENSHAVYFFADQPIETLSKLQNMFHEQIQHPTLLKK